METILLFCFTTAEWISIIAAIAALVTAFIALRTITEVKKQREHSYHPDINMANFSFYVYRYDPVEEEGEEPEDLTYLFYSKTHIEENVPIKGYNELNISMNNIGFGVAKRITWKWEFNLSKAKESIMFEEEDSWQYDNGDLMVKAKRYKVDWICLIDEDNDSDYFNFILPYSKENRNTEIRIPKYFLDLYWLYKVNETMDKPSNIDYPALKLTIDYTNIHGKEFEKVFLLNLNWSFVSNPDNDKNELAKFRFEINEMN